MPLEKQVSNKELSQRLKKLGVRQNGMYVWVQSVVETWNVELEMDAVLPVHASSFCSAFTVAELGEMLPKDENIVTMLFENGRCQMVIQEGARYQFGDILVGRWGAAGQAIWGDTEADARAKMLIYLIENKLLTPHEIKRDV